MMIPHGFDVSNEERRKKVVDTAKKTAKKFNDRITLFLADIDKNASINASRKEEIKKILLKNLID